MGVEMNAPYRPRPSLGQRVFDISFGLAVLGLVLTLYCSCIDRAEPCDGVWVDGECLAECDYPRPIHGSPTCSVDGVRCELHETDEGQTAWVCVPAISASEPHKDAAPRPAP